MNILSIITATRNNHDLLDITFKSIRKEKTQGVEYIVIDGQSDDDTLTLIRNNNDIIDVYTSEIDSGVYDAMNKGLSIASGRYVLFLNSGDEIIGLNKVISDIKDIAFLEKRILLYASKFTWKNSMTKIIQPSFAYCIMPTSHQAILYHLETAKSYRYDLAYRFSGDYDLYLKLLKKSQCQINVYKHIIVKTSPVGFTETGIKDYLNECYKINLNYNSKILATIRYGVELIRFQLKNLAHKILSESMIDNLRILRGGKY